MMYRQFDKKTKDCCNFYVGKPKDQVALIHYFDIQIMLFFLLVHHVCVGSLRRWCAVCALRLGYELVKQALLPILLVA